MNVDGSARGHQSLPGGTSRPQPVGIDWLVCADGGKPLTPTRPTAKADEAKAELQG
jgi:hypothetical protein